jgi:branched-chain amino acid transport system substrate-binding protein
LTPFRRRAKIGAPALNPPEALPPGKEDTYRKKAIGFALAVLATSVVAASAQGGQKVAAGGTLASAGYSCKKTITLPLVTPVTGGAGFLGAEQGSWAKYAVKTLAPKLGLKVKFVLGDTPVEQGPAPAQALAQKYVAAANVLAILGPSTSGAVAASSATYGQAKIAHISPSATRTSLTQGASKEASSAFFRVVPGDYIQGPSDANFMIKTLKVKKVVLLDFQEPYSVGLSDAVEGTLKKNGVSTTRLSAPNTTTDYSAYVSRVPNDADIVFFPTQKPGDAQTFAQQLIEQGKKAKVFGGDGSNDPSQFKQPGSYVSNFAPLITGIKSDAAIVAAWKKQNPGKAVGSFGPPTYGAAQIAMNAIALACKAGHGTATRQAVLRSVKKVRIKNWILGGSFRWSTKTNDPLNAKFYIFQIQSNGSYKLVN